MTIRIKEQEVVVETDKVTVLLNDVEFIFSINKFNELVVNKQQYGEGEGSIIITPRVSNEIIIK